MNDWERCSKCGTTGYANEHRCGGFEIIVDGEHGPVLFTTDHDHPALPKVGLHAQSGPAISKGVGPHEEMTIETFKARCAAMREERASKAWGIELELPTRSFADDDEETTQRPSAAKAELLKREHRRRVAQSASGGPLRRVDEL